MEEIVTRHQVRKQQANFDPFQTQPSTNVGLFTVTSANTYMYSEGDNSDESNEQSQERTVQIRIHDVLFSNRVCSLVYMHDTTNLLKSRDSKNSYHSRRTHFYK